MNRYDIGLYGLWFGHNYGSILTYYALYKTLSKSGKTCAMIDNPLRTEKDINILRRSHALRFGYEHYNIAPFFRLDEMYRLDSMFDTFVIGSDQMWNSSLCRPYGNSYFLDFTSDAKRRFAYGTSFGNKDSIPQHTEKIKQLLERFDSISIRDDFSADVLDKTFGIKSDIVLDPVFLLSEQDYEDLISEAENTEYDISKPYIFAYILDPNIVIGDCLSMLANELGIDVCVCFDESGNTDILKKSLGIRSDRVTYLDSPTAQEWLFVIKNSSFVITDSYHGTCFSALFRKPALIKKNSRRGAQRFEHISRVLGLEKCMVNNPALIFDTALSVFEKNDLNLNDTKEILMLSHKKKDLITGAAAC